MELNVLQNVIITRDTGTATGMATATATVMVKDRTVSKATVATVVMGVTEVMAEAVTKNQVTDFQEFKILKT